jgi:hypothetical protein
MVEMLRVAQPLEHSGTASRPARRGSAAIAFASFVLAASPAAAQSGHASQTADRSGGVAAMPAEPDQTPQRGRFADPADDQFDLSEFLATARGFLPVPIVVTEPAVGYGGGAAALVLRPRRDEGSAGWSRPNLSAAGALATENGTWAGFAGDSSNWFGDRLRTLAGVFMGDIHLDFYRPTPADPGASKPVSYSLDTVGALAEASWRPLTDADWWVGLRYAYADVDASLRRDPAVPPPDDAGRVTVSAPALLLTYDSRDNLFTPTKGLYASSSLLFSREALGSSADYERFDQVMMGWTPIGRDFTLGLRGDYGWASTGTPFFLLPFVMLRGVPVMRHAGEEAASLEAELRWRVHGRWSLVGFGGHGWTRTRGDLLDVAEDVGSGGIGVRYEIARRFGMHVGVDVARSADTTAFYLVVGNAWFRP